METSSSGWIGKLLGRPLRLAVLGLCLAMGLHAALEPTNLKPRRPWIAAGEPEAGAPESGPQRFHVTPDHRADAALVWIEFDRAGMFAESTLRALADLADRINSLRRIATAAHRASPASRETASLLFAEEVAALQAWAETVQAEGCYPLASDRPIAVETDANGARAVRYELPRWHRDAFGLDPTPLADQLAAEQTLGALDRGYYRVVAAYREVAELEAWLEAREAP